MKMLLVVAGVLAVGMANCSQTCRAGELKPMEMNRPVTVHMKLFCLSSTLSFKNVLEFSI